MNGPPPGGPHVRGTLLSPEQRARLFDVPTSPAEMAKYYVLSAEDLTLVRTKRRSSNRLGFAAFGEYALRDQTRREHAVELQQFLRLRSFRLADWRACLRAGTNAAWATDRGEPIVQAMLAHLRTEGILNPGAAVLERIGLAARMRARRHVFRILGRV